MQGMRMLAAVIISASAMLAWMAMASIGVAADQLGDPLVGYFAVHTRECLTAAAAALVLGSMLFVCGSKKGAAILRVRDIRNPLMRLELGASDRARR